MNKDFYIDVAAGSNVFTEGEIGNDMFIIESGQVELVRKGGESLITLGAGEFLGECALEHKPHLTSARATSKARLLRIERTAFNDVVKQNPEIAVRILRQMVERQSDLAGAYFATMPKPEPEAKISAPVAASVIAEPVVAAPIPAPAPARAPAPVPSPPAPPSVAPKQKVLALHPAGASEPMPLDSAKSDFLVGRPDAASGINPEVDLSAFNANGTLSRRHARILREGSLYFLREETGVANGTFVNGERIESGAKVPIKPGDKLRFGLIDVDVVSV